MTEHQHAISEIPLIALRRGAVGAFVPILHGTGVRVQTIAVARSHGKMSSQTIAEEYNLSVAQVE